MEINFYNPENNKVKNEIGCYLIIKKYYEENPLMVSEDYSFLSLIRKEGVKKLEKKCSEIKLHPNLASSVLEVGDFFKKIKKLKQNVSKRRINK
ncbi:hypothetical protein KAJ87_00115 [Candidatus Pacearchaeota archaeon]|nr:hypothetical protein [Candidatus Pacearchaeota archaeon]